MYQSLFQLEFHTFRHVRVREGRKEVSKYFRATGMYRFPLDSALCTGYTPIHFIVYIIADTFFIFWSPFSHSALIECSFPEIQNPSNVFFRYQDGLMWWVSALETLVLHTGIGQIWELANLGWLLTCWPVSLAVDAELLKDLELDITIETLHCFCIFKILKLVSCWQLCWGLKMNVKILSLWWVRAHHNCRSRISISKMDLDSWMEWICFVSIV